MNHDMARDYLCQELEIDDWVIVYVIDYALRLCPEMDSTFYRPQCNFIGVVEEVWDIFPYFLSLMKKTAMITSDGRLII